MAEWISVKERLPEPGERVLLSDGTFVAEGYILFTGEWMRNGIWVLPIHPTHWMPLPEPPKEETNEIPSKPKRGKQAESKKANTSQKPFFDYRWGDCQGEEGGPRRGNCEMGEA